MTLFNLDSLWGVFNLISNAGHGEFMIILSKRKGNSGRKKIQLKIKILEALQQRNKRECEDIVKVFVINKSIFFSSGFLSEMFFDAENFSAGFRNHLRGNNDQLSKFLSILNISFRGQGSAAGFEAKTEEWACRNFIIRTYIWKDVASGRIFHNELQLFSRHFIMILHNHM